MKLSAQARDRLSKLLDDSVFCYKGTYKKADVLRLIEEIVRTPSFSEGVVTNTEVKRRCNLGHWHVVYRLTFRTVLLPALRILARPGTLMTTPELVNACENPNEGRMVGKYVAELRHFGLIDQLSDGRYWATQLAHDFLAGTATIPAWTWPQGEKLPEECVDGPPKLVSELEDVHPKGEKSRHLDEAVPT